MAYVKNIWVDQDVERPKTYEVTNNQDGSITLTDSFGLVTELGTPVNEVNMNHIEDGIDGCAIRKHNLTETFNLGEWVLGGTGDDEGIYKSLIANNVGNAITDDTKWEKVEMGGGSSRDIGEIVQSTVPQTDAGLHLLDGALIQYGSYSAFVDHIADLVTDYPDLFCTEADWQTSVTQYGACDKYVYDSVNNTVRIPKRNSEHGDLIKSYKSGTNWYRIYSDGWCEQGGVVSADTISFLKTYVDTNYNLQLTIGNNDTGAYQHKDYPYSKTTTGFTTSGATGFTVKDWRACGYTDISDYQYSPIYEYLVIATSTKTDIEVDIDEIATDLNGKADVDLTNVNNQAKVLMSRMGMPSDTYVDLTLGASGSTYTMPADGYLYFDKTAGGNDKWVVFSSSDMGVDGEITYVANVSSNHGTFFIPVRKGITVTVSYTLSGATNYFRFIYAVGSESEA